MAVRRTAFVDGSVRSPTLQPRWSRLEGQRKGVTVSGPLRRGCTVPLEFPRPDFRVAHLRSDTVKILIVIAASVASAALVTPTVTQGQGKTVMSAGQLAAAQAAQPLRA